MSQTDRHTGSPSLVSAEEERISLETFLKKCGGLSAEWTIGRVEAHEFNNTLHQDALGFLCLLPHAFLSLNPAGRGLLAGVVSPESVERDYSTKFAEYEFAGMKEYRLFDPLRQAADMYMLTEVKAESDTACRYRRARPEAHGRLTATLLPGFACDPAVGRRDTQPDCVETPAIVQTMVGQA